MADSLNIIGAFSEESAARLSGLKASRLRYWQKTAVFSASLVADEPGSPFQRLYSFRDLVTLRLLQQLAVEYNVLPSELRATGERLAKAGEDWLSRRLWVRNRRVIWKEPQSGRKQEVTTGQFVTNEIPLRSLARDMVKRIGRDSERKPEDLGKVITDRFTLRNRPFLSGTRVAVASIKDFHEAGYSIPKILEEYPGITAVDVQAAIDYEDGSAAA
jgi:hypothetical protein